MKVVSAAQMREMDRQTIEEFGVPSVVLMENAALRVVEEMARRWVPLAGKRVAVVCGKGNNGGDGFAVARHLSARFGADVTVWLAADPAGLTEDARANYDMAVKFGLNVRRVEAALVPPLRESELVVDALLGTGIRGAVTGLAADLINDMNDCGRPVIAVDLPSGLDADTGNIAGPCVNATLTVTFALPKFGLMVYPGASFVGELIVADIGMPRAVMAAESVTVWVMERADVARWLPSRAEGRDANKGTFGHVTVLAGSRGFVGAPVMAAEASARAGAGLVTLAVPESLQTAAMSRVSPVVMTRGLAETPDGTFGAHALESAFKLAAKGTVAALGPGLGAENEDTGAFVRELIARCPVPLVIDADGLNVLSQEPDRGASLVKGRAAPTVLTPHPGEMGRLLGLDTKAVQADRRGAVERAAATFGCVVLLKGGRTLTATPDGGLFINTTGNAGMATGGAGDVLTGVIAALLACGMGPSEAASAGAFVHGLAGDIVADAHGGKAGLVATDLIDALPRALGRCQGEAE